MLEEITAFARSSYIGYCSVMRPKFKVLNHLVPVNRALQDVMDGRLTRLIVAMPPRWGKSFGISETFPAAMFSQNPTLKYMQAAYGQPLAAKFGREVRGQMQGALFKELFGHGVARDVSASQLFETTAGGMYLADGIGGSFTGFGSNVFGIDDPIKNRAEAESAAYRRQVTDFIQGVAYDRLENFSDGREPIIMVAATRWHVEDLTGWLRKNMPDEGWIYIALPAVTNSQGARCGIDDPDAVSQFPDQYPLDRLQKIKTAVGSYEWEAKYQQNPTPLLGGIINLDWFQRYTILPRVSYKVHSWDTAQKTELTSAYSVCGTWETAAGRHYLTNIYRERLQYPDLKRAVKDLAERDQPKEIMIEDKASGIQLIQDLRRETTLPIIAIEPEGDKISRAFGQSALVEAGLVYLPESAPWLPDFESEIRAFPAGDYADQVDQLTQYLTRHRNRSDGFAFARTGPRDSAAVSTSQSGGFRRTG